MRSLEQRLQLGLSLSLLSLFAILWFLGQKSMNELTHEFVVSRLEHDIESLLSAIKISADSVKIAQERVAPIYQQPFSGHYYSVSINNAPAIYSHSLWDESLISPRVKAGGRILQTTDGPNNQKLLLISMGFNKQGQNISISLGEDLSAIEVQKQKFKNRFALFSLSGLIILLLLQSIILRLSFKRLELLQTEIQRLGDGKLIKLSDDVPSEVLPLVQEINHLLSLLEQRLMRSRNALGNLTHALKTPLSLLYQYFDHNVSKEHEARTYVDRINRLMDRELKRARLAGKGTSRQRFNASSELPELIKVVKQIYSHREITIDYQLSDTLVPFCDREDMLELIGNLLDNACKWANNDIHISLTNPESNQVSIIIEDDGQGVTEEQIDSLTRRGMRLDETLEGHGLGLSIVNDIVKLYGGSISFVRSSSLGGLQVKIDIETRLD